MARHAWTTVSVVALTMFGGPARGIAVAQPPIVQQSGTAPSISPQALAQMAALAQEKASRTPAERKIASRLLYAIKMQRGFFDTFFLLGNPQGADARVTLTYLLDSGEVVIVPVTIPAHGRLTINPEAGTDPRLQNAAFSNTVAADVPIVAERSMYWAGKATPWGEGHTGSGVPAPALTWDLAEGRAGGGHQFHSYILVSNPQSTAAELTVTYLRETGAPIVRTYTVPAASRLTIDANALPELADQNFGARVAVTNSVPVVVERSMYWNANGIFWSGGSNGTGVPVPVP